MTCEKDKKCFTIIWKIENASYSLQEDYKCIESPAFTLDDINETIWKLELDLLRDGIGFFLQRQEDKKTVKNIDIVCEFAFISADGTVSHSYDETYSVEIDGKGTYGFALLNEVFCEKRSLLLPQDTLTTRCRIWKSVGDMSKNVQYFARTRIVVEKRTFLWNIKKFSSLQPASKKTYKIKSLDNGKQLMSLVLFLTGGIIYDEKICLKIIPCHQNIKNSTLQVSIVDSSKNTLKCFEDEFLARDPFDSKDFTLFYTKRELMEKKNVYLPNNVLSLLCECAFSFGIVQEEIEEGKFDCVFFERKELGDSCLLKENNVLIPKSILIDNLKSMLNNSCLSDVTLRTKSQIYPAHKFILGARSPVFKAMFSTDMREKISDCVDIEDLNDKTVSLLLHYIYSAEVGELDWDIATELYEAADKYQILSLKDICSSYLKKNLCPSHACKLLILADMHQDKALRVFVQDFILRRGMDIINSEEWEQLMETNLKLAAETMRLRYKMQ